MNRTVLVTGGAGSMGRLVVERLLSDGDTVRAFDLPTVSFDGLEGRAGVEVVQGDLADAKAVARAVGGADAVVHLAAILPPATESNPDLTRCVNVDGTETLLRATERVAEGARFVFSSSVSVYGDTSGETAPIPTTRESAPDDVYAQSKADAERLVMESGLDWVALRISGVVIPVFQAPPAEWPFTPDERIEFVHRDDAVAALTSAASSGPGRAVYNIAGGESWRVTGEAYVRDTLERLEVDASEAVYQDHPGHFDWYDTGESQTALRYQYNSYQAFFEQLEAEIARLLEE